MPFLDHEGKLAFTFGWYTEQDRPVRARSISVSKARASDWPHLLEPPVMDRQIDWAGNIGVVHFGGFQRVVRFDTTDWERIVEEVPEKKPRRGKCQGQAYDWEWVRGKWVRKWL